MTQTFVGFCGRQTLKQQLFTCTLYYLHSGYTICNSICFPRESNPWPWGC